MILHQAKSQLSRLVERAKRGEEVLIARKGRQFPNRVPGTAKGKIWIAEDFNVLPEDVLEHFYK